MRYYIIDLVMMKLYPYNNLDDLIKLLGAETEIIIPVEESTENIIFNPKVFNTPEKLARLKQTISGCIGENPAKDEKKIDVSKKNQLFYLYAALLSLPDVIANESMVNFVRQIALWFPEYLSLDKKEQRNYEQSLSHEKKKWEQEDELLKVTAWKTFIKQSSMSLTKAKYFEALAMKIYTTVNELLKGIRQEKR